MEQIVRRKDGLYYGETRCSSADEVYRFFREDYNRSIDRDSNRRLNREGQRTDVLHWKGFVLSEPYYERLSTVWDSGLYKVRSSVIGILHTAYCRTVDCRCLDSIGNDEVDDFLDWALSDNSKALVLVNRKNGLGRTNRRNNINFKR